MFTFLKTALWFINFVIYLIFTLFFAVKIKWLEFRGKTQESAALLQRVVRPWAKFMWRSTGSEVEVYGLENIPEGTVLFVSNHQGNFDIPILLTSLDRAHAFVSKKELSHIPILSFWMRRLGCVFLDRGNPRSAVKTLGDAAKTLKGGTSMIIFPEGHRSKGEEIHEFQNGAFKIAQKSNVPIVPVRIDGSYKLMEKNRGFIKADKVRVKILPPVEVSGGGKAALAELADDVKERIKNAF